KKQFRWPGPRAAKDSAGSLVRLPPHPPARSSGRARHQPQKGATTPDPSLISLEPFRPSDRRHRLDPPARTASRDRSPAHRPREGAGGVGAPIARPRGHTTPRCPTATAKPPTTLAPDTTN